MPGDITSYVMKKNDILSLCLYYNGDCISSITFRYKENNIEISSRTDEKYQGRKYNKLLRILTIIICGILICEDTNIKYITSNPENWISAWLLIDNFEVKFEDDEEFQELVNENRNNGDKLRNIVKDYYSLPNIEIEINDHNLEKANNLFDELLSSSDNKKNIKCPEMNI